jgi:hypothetical protein
MDGGEASVGWIVHHLEHAFVVGCSGLDSNQKSNGSLLSPKKGKGGRAHQPVDCTRVARLGLTVACARGSRCCCS